LFHLDPLSLGDANQVPAVASDFLFNPNGMILNYVIMPAVPQSPFADLLVPEYLSLTFRTSDGYHLRSEII
jgi:hypothetical protein